MDNILNKIKMNSRVQKAVLFGSRAMGNYKDGSDIDIALFGKDLKLNDLLDMSSELDNLWLPNRFDLVLFHHINEPALLDHIGRVGITLWDRYEEKSST